MRLILGVSLAIMGVGFFVVFGVIVYRLSQHGPAAGEAVVTALGLPADARLLSMTADGGRVFLAVESGGRTSIHVVDGARLSEIGRIELGSMPPPAAVPLRAPGGAAPDGTATAP